MKLSEVIAEADDGGPIIEVTRQVVKAVLHDHQDVAAEILFRPIRSQVRLRRRQHARAAEDQAFGASTAASANFDADPLTALRELRNSSFWEPQDGMVTWGEATAEQHGRRADWIREKQIAPLEIDAERHELAAELITDAGVERLAELAYF